MSLREEIYHRIRKSFPDNNPNTVTFLSVEIIKVFEKRIDQFYFDEPEFNDDLMIKMKEMLKT